ncbi:MAG: cation:proton antiporter [Akkermansiaceae bacterium]|jgi:NhaP-type Na+/H+ or K+/H+ antiporter|nr:cation:proton antiporter [Akkermansiaceae bacterium]
MLPAVFIGLLFAYSLVSARLAKTVVTAPIVFTLAGLGMFFIAQPADGRMHAGAFLTLAEIGLVLLLFTDASRTDLRILRNIRELPARLLSVGMLLTILLGALAAKLVFPQLSWWEAGILSAILAPTDAGLGQIIVNSPLVPMRVRQALNVEAGLNDGLSVPFLLFFIAMAGAGEGGAGFARFIGEQLGLGALVGAGIGLTGGWLLNAARRAQWMAESFLQLAVVALPVFCLLFSEPLGASPFIAAFVAGLFVQVRFKHAGKHSVEFTEEWGQIFNLAVFFLFGMIIARESGGFAIAPIIYALLSLTVVRMLPVAVSLIGSGLDKTTIAFMGWFGPRGLASIVLGLVYLEQEKHLPGEQVTRHAVMATVLLSILAHGLSAKPGIRLLAREN